MIRLALRVRREQAELALAELLELAPSGVEERDLGAEVEYAIYGAPGELPALPDLQVAVGDALVAVRSQEVADDWAQRWREFHRPVLVAGRVRVRPPWAPAVEEPEVLDLVVDPGQAFGTGAHATTRLCLEELVELEPRPGGLLDLGCGSGLLAIAAARLGWAPVRAVDFDGLAVAATELNARVNAVDGQLEIGRLDLRRDPIPPAGVVLANLLRPLLLELAGRLEEVPDVLVAGGLLAGEADEVAGAFARHGLHERGRRQAEGWVALRLERTSAKPAAGLGPAVER